MAGPADRFAWVMLATGAVELRTVRPRLPRLPLTSLAVGLAVGALGLAAVMALRPAPARRWSMGWKAPASQPVIQIGSPGVESREPDWQVGTPPPSR